MAEWSPWAASEAVNRLDDHGRTAVPAVVEHWEKLAKEAAQ